MMAGYYDDDAAANASGWMETARATKQVDGIMYTTWKQDYSQLEAFIAAAKKR